MNREVVRADICRIAAILCRIHQADANIVAVGDILDAADFSRARLAAVGDVANNVGYNIEFDFGFPGRPSFMDVWLEVRDLAWLQNVRVEQYRNPFSLDGLIRAWQRG